MNKMKQKPNELEKGYVLALLQADLKLHQLGTITEEMASDPIVNMIEGISQDTPFQMFLQRLIEYRETIKEELKELGVNRTRTKELKQRFGIGIVPGRKVS